MSTTIRLNYTAAAYLQSAYDSNTAYDSSNSHLLMTSGLALNVHRDVVVSFGAIPSTCKNKKLIRADVIATGKSASYSDYGGSKVYGILQPVDVSTVLPSTLPKLTVDTNRMRLNGIYGIEHFPAGGTAQETTFTASYLFTGVPQPDTSALRQAFGSKAILSTNCVLIGADTTGVYISGPIYLDIEYDETVTITSQVTQTNCPTSGWINPAIDQTFSWEFDYVQGYPSVASFVQSSATFYWKESADANYTAVAASGAEQSVTIPANTFPGGTISWYIEATDTDGTTSQTPVYTITTEDSTATAIPTDPVNIPETGNAEITFKWIVENTTGAAPSGADLQKSSDGSTWSSLASVSGSSTEYVAPANTFSAGAVYWRVRAYNRDGVAGPWSDSVSFICVAGPPAPVVTVTSSPFATVNWQSDGQQAYRVTVDGVVYGPYFGNAKSFDIPDYLTDGAHTISVEVQGSYGIWSAPGSATATISNTAGNAVTLSGSFGIDAFLSITTTDAVNDFYIYRDEVLIGHTTESTFADRMTLGTHTWYVLNRLPGGNYTKSNAVVGTVSTDTTMIAAKDGGDWIDLKLTERSETQQVYQYTKSSSLHHVSGALFPALELSPYENVSVSYDCAFKDAEDAEAFEGIRGKVVVIKSRGILVVGALTSIRKTVGDFYQAYEFTVQRIHWEDFVDEQND